MLKIENNSEHKGERQKIQNCEEIYICSCRKEYKSFPALYLHNRKKHGILIKIEEKSRMSKKNVWSGRKKKIVYQFQQQSQAIEQSPKKQQQHSQVFFSDQVQKSQLLLQPLDRNLTKQIFQNFWIQKYGNSIIGVAHSQKAMELLDQLIYYFEGNIHRYLNTSRIQIKNTQNKLAFLPLVFNFFIADYLPKTQCRILNIQSAKNLLLTLSGWLFEKKISPYLVVPNQL